MYETAGRDGTAAIAPPLAGDPPGGRGPDFDLAVALR
jgi:hypothetical protein